MASYRTIATWTAKDAVFADNDAENAAYVKFLNNRQVLVFPDTAEAVGTDDFYAFFRGVIPRSYSGGEIQVWLWGTNEDVGAIPAKFSRWYGKIQRHNLDDPILTLSYGDEESELMGASTANYLLKSCESLEFDTAALRDNIAACDAFTLQIRRDGAAAADDLADTAYLYMAHMYEVFE